jgi:hypothetical protein
MPFSSAATTVQHLPPRRKAVWGWRVRVLAFAVLLSGLAVPAAVAQIRVTAAWDANADALTVGYQVFVGSSAGAPLVSIDVGGAVNVGRKSDRSAE